MADPVSIAVAAFTWVTTTALPAIATFAAAHPILWAGAKFAGSMLLSSILAPKPPKMEGPGTQLAFKADLGAGLPVAVGRTAVGGNIVHQYPSGAKNKYMSFIVALCAAGPVEAIETFYANRTATSLGAGGLASGWGGKMWQTQTLGVSPETAIAWPSGLSYGDRPTHWTSDHKVSGVAKAWWVLDYDPDAYPSGVPQPMWLGKWVRCWDPRDEAQDLGDPQTWAWTENPYVIGLQFCLGWFQNGKRVAGAGIDLDMIDLASFVEGANIADANLVSEDPDLSWTCGGQFSTRDSKWQVLKSILQAGGGRPSMTGARVSCIVNAPRTSLAQMEAGDILGAISVKAVRSRRDRINSVTPRFRSPEHDWQVVAASPVTKSDYVDADGELRSREIDYPFVQNARQAAQLAAYDIANGRELEISLTCGPKWMGYRPGDCIRVHVEAAGLSEVVEEAVVGRKAIITSRQIDPQTGAVSMTLITETEAKHDWALGQEAAAPVIPGLSLPDFANVDAPTGWTATPVVESNGGVTALSIQVAGANDNPFTTEIIVEYRSDSGDPWKVWTLLSPRATGTVITGLVGLTPYEVAISYRTVYGVVGARQELDAVFTGEVPGDMVFDNVSDGDTLDFGKVLPALPEVYIDAANCIVPASGEARHNTVTALSTSSVTVSIKNTTPSGLTAQSASGVQEVDLNWYIDKPTADDAQGGVYAFSATMTPAAFSTPGGTIYSAVVDVYYRVSGSAPNAWIYAGRMGGQQANGSAGTVVSRQMTITGAIGQDGGKEFFYVAHQGTISALSVGYDTIGSGSAVSATDTYHKARVTVRPKLA
ncbi:hypothetical protein ABI_21940 [Asticcacaulis biprosthecium C19]|uniref:Uncharacterized protein n=1 Tax=Asticcacaulis biprosthecium C19 TaxID=715226 RepID=F4QGZ9_9CAUL|nr:phage tail protein [Asticcacaulis biprosthecium]EGF93752.1 hypothetical protein ABI_21940 [Asticcacaulis biprosthecium C19]